MVAFHVLVLTVLVLVAGAAQANPVKLTAAEAIQHSDENAKVCGLVTSTNYAPTRRGKPTFLDLDRSHPSPEFTAVIWGNSRPEFAYPPESLDGKKICVTGMISSHFGRAYMEVHSAQQIDVQPDLQQ
jgi:hypothetical protein